MKLSLVRILLVASVGLAFGACASEPSSGPPERPDPNASDTAATEDATVSEPDANDPEDVDPAEVTDPPDAPDDTTATTDTTPSDTAPSDTEPADTEPADAAEDVEPEDTGSADVAPTDSGPADTGEDTATEPELEVVRLILIGDFGEGNEAQYRVAESAARHCDERGGCHALVTLGDNIYDEGPSSADDWQFTEYMDLPYANMRYGPPPAEGEEDTRPRLPMLVSLGNHDLGGAGLDSSLARHFIEYGRDRDWFYFPGRYWDRQLGPVHLVVLDTNPLAYLGTEVDEQGAMVRRVTDTTDARWTLVIGHHPYRSNGDHGNAGSYEGVPGDLVFLGGAFRRFVDEYICNRADFYICGHEHNRQWMESVPRIPSWPIFPPPDPTFACATEFGVSGAGAKDDELVDRDNDLAFGSQWEGYLYMEFTADGATAEFGDIDGNVEWTREFR